MAVILDILQRTLQLLFDNSIHSASQTGIKLSLRVSKSS